MSLLSFRDFTRDEVYSLIDYANEMKNSKGDFSSLLCGKSIGLLFFKNSTRTFVSFSVGINELGGNVVTLDKEQIQLNRGESIEHTAKTLSCYLHGLVVRCDEHKFLEDLAYHGSIPIINALSDEYHPCQVAADLMTIRKYHKDLSQVSIAFVGDCSCNMASSFVLAARLMGFKLSLIGLLEEDRKKEYQEDKNISFYDDMDALNGNDYIYTDTWISMGTEDQSKVRLEKYKRFQLNEEVLTRVKNDFKIMHCLPAHIGEEITQGIIDSKQSIIWEQAENRLHIQKAIMGKMFNE